MSGRQTNESTIIKKNKNTWILIVVFLIVLLISLIVVGFILTENIRSQRHNKTIEEQLELGNKYLNELDYEQAIVAYEVAIEIDPMSVDAYIGLADAYIGQGDIGKAILTLEQGYEATGSQLVLDKLNELLNASTQSVNQAIDIMANQISIDKDIPAQVIDGVYHNAYYKFDLSNEDSKYLKEIIDILECGNYEKAVVAIDYDKVKNIINSLGFLWTNSDGDVYQEGGSVNIVFEGRKVFLNVTNYNFYSKGVDIMVLPLDEGTGYALHDYLYTWTPESSRHNSAYIYGECKEGVFWGDFSCVENVYNLYEDKLEECYIFSGTTWNGLVDGELVFTINDSKVVSTYNKGIIHYWDLRDNGSQIYASEGICTDLNGQESDYTYHYYEGFTKEEVANIYETEVNSITEALYRNNTISSSTYYAIDGAPIHYPW